MRRVSAARVVHWSSLALVFPLVLAMLVSIASAHDRMPSPRAVVQVEVIAANGTVLRQFPAQDMDRATRSYLEATRGERYRIRIRNTSGERVAVVVAVDGRNIISGARSELAAGEPKYVLGPWESADYSGWRTDLDSVNQFYFTAWQDSYAEAFGDRSARGVIAVAAFREQHHVRQPHHRRAPLAAHESAAAATHERTARASAPAAGQAADQAAEAEPGTGYGERREEGAVQVQFRAQSREQARVLIKYEWRETLCRRGLLTCAPANRLWGDEKLSFAPPPPRVRPR